MDGAALTAYATSVWADGLAHLLPRHERIGLGLSDLRRIGRKGAVLSPDLYADLAQLFPAFPGGAHLRLDLCSLRAPTAPRLTGADQAADWLTRPNPRVARCCELVEAMPVEAGLYLFEWHDMAPWTEYRAFLRGGTVAGISQYHWDRRFAPAQMDAARDGPALFRLCGQLLAADVPDCAADLFMQPDGTARLIELNPLGPTTDPCLFRDRAFDGRLHVLGGSAHAVAAGAAGTATEGDVWRL